MGAYNTKSKGIKIFFTQSLRKFIKNGSLIPSSKYLGNMMLKNVIMRPNVIVAELGAGTGAFTNMILSKMPKNGKLLVFEINPVLVKHIQIKIVDPRVTIIKDDAINIKTHLQKIQVKKPDYIISSIPIGNMTRTARKLLLLTIYDCLNDNGLFIQFQYFLASLLPVRKIFKTSIVGYEYRNMPPAFVYNCRKKSTN